MKDYSDSEKSLKNNNKESKQSNLLSIVLAIVLIVSNVFWFYQYNSLKDEFEPSKIKIEELNNQLKELNNQLEESNNQLKQAKTAREILDNVFKDNEKEMTKVPKSLSDSVEKLN